MSLINQYLGNTGAISRANRSAHSNFNNFAGSQTGSLSADGTGSSRNIPTSQPYQLLISNSSASVISNVDVLGAFQYLYNPPNGSSWSNGVLTTQTNITITSLTSTSYQGLLSQTLINPFTVAYTQVSANNVSAQAFVPFTVTTTDANGNTLSNSFPMIQDLYQQSTNGAATFSNFSVDGLTKMTFAQVLGNASFVLYLYPAVNVNPAQALAGNGVVNQFGNPNVIRQSTQVLAATPATVVNRIGR